jgi:septal ring factor EnvC (AmiA/AmiB activator)
LTRLAAERTLARGGGDAISEGIASTTVQSAGAEAYDLDRLERAVSVLIDGVERLRQENRQLREQLASRGQRIQALENEVRHANQRRQDVAKRIDELIGQIDQIEVQLAGREDA